MEGMDGYDVCLGQELLQGDERRRRDRPRPGRDTGRRPGGGSRKGDTLRHHAGDRPEADDPSVCTAGEAVNGASSPAGPGAAPPRCGHMAAGSGALVRARMRQAWLFLPRRRHLGRWPRGCLRRWRRQRRCRRSRRGPQRGASWAAAEPAPPRGTPPEMTTSAVATSGVTLPVPSLKGATDSSIRWANKAASSVRRGLTCPAPRPAYTTRPGICQPALVQPPRRGSRAIGGFHTDELLVADGGWALTM